MLLFEHCVFGEFCFGLFVRFDSCLFGNCEPNESIKKMTSLQNTKAAQSVDDQSMTTLFFDPSSLY